MLLICLSIVIRFFEHSFCNMQECRRRFILGNSLHWNSGGVKLRAKWTESEHKRNGECEGNALLLMIVSQPHSLPVSTAQIPSPPFSVTFVTKQNSPTLWEQNKTSTPQQFCTLSLERTARLFEEGDREPQKSSPHPTFFSNLPVAPKARRLFNAEPPLSIRKVREGENTLSRCLYISLLLTYSGIAIKYV